jgi:threonine dehydratase
MIDLTDVLAAFQYLRKTGMSTPLEECTILGERFNANIFLKHEECNWGGSFKIRNALYYLSRLSREQLKGGVVCATRGNFGIGISLAARQVGCKATVVVPECNVEEKNSLIRSCGAEVVIAGKDFDEAAEQAKLYAHTHNMLFVSTADAPEMIQATSTIALEIFMRLQKLDYLIVPIGSGSLLAGTIVVRNAISPHTKVIGVQAYNASVMYQSWKSGRVCQSASCDTIADGLATRSVVSLPFDIIKRHVDDILLLTEEEIKRSVYFAFQTARIAIEPASATVFGCLETLGNNLSGKNIALVVTGKNFSQSLFKEVLRSNS